MGPVADNSPLVVILGPTASGKTALAIDLARRFNGEVIAADSRTVYKGMDIGTAKPNVDERRQIPHHLLDIVSPGESFTVADFQRLANKVIADVTARGKLPILVGGSGLYIDAVIYNFSFLGGPDLALREELRSSTVEELQQQLRERRIPLPENQRNARYLIRVLETGGLSSQREQLRPGTAVIGLDPGREVLHKKIVERVDAMVNLGFVEEVRKLVEAYGQDALALQTPGYKAFYLYLVGEVSLDQAKKLSVQGDLQYAKRQKTWFKRNPDINWISKTAEAVDLVTTLLNK
jgi:tRNA dimethylallyltransferase